MVTIRELISKIDEIKEDAPFATAVSTNPQQKTSDDIGRNFIATLAHASTMHQAEILGLLFGADWEHPHTAEEISAKYVSAPAEKRNEVDGVLKNAA